MEVELLCEWQQFGINMRQYDDYGSNAGKTRPHYSR